MTRTEVREYGSDDPSRSANKKKITDDGRSVDAVVGTLDAALEWFHVIPGADCLKSSDILRPSQDGEMLRFGRTSCMPHRTADLDPLRALPTSSLARSIANCLQCNENP